MERPKSVNPSNVFWHKPDGNFLTDWPPSVRHFYRLSFLADAAALEPELLPSLRKLRAADTLSAWAERWHLTDPWCLAIARDQRRCWEKHPKFKTAWNFDVEDSQAEDNRLSEGKELTMSRPAHDLVKAEIRLSTVPAGVVNVSLRDPITDFGAHVELWDPTLMTRAAYVNGVLRVMKRALDLYCDGMENIIRAGGFQPLTRKHGGDHFEWLARYQVKGESLNKIASSVTRDRVAVSDAVKGAAKLLSLTLRPRGKPGRPRKQ